MNGVRRFWLERDEDVSGVSGTGRVAEGCEFPDGKAVLWWWNTGSVTVFAHIEHLTRVHGQNGKTRIFWED